MIDPALRVPLAIVAIAIVVLGTWRFYGGQPMSLPGDISYDSEGLSVRFPWVSCLVLSAFGNLLMRALTQQGQQGPRREGRQA